MLLPCSWAGLSGPLDQPTWRGRGWGAYWCGGAGSAASEEGVGASHRKEGAPNEAFFQVTPKSRKWYMTVPIPGNDRGRAQCVLPESTSCLDRQTRARLTWERILY